MSQHDALGAMLSIAADAKVDRKTRAQAVVALLPYVQFPTQFDWMRSILSEDALLELAAADFTEFISVLRAMRATEQKAFMAFSLLLLRLEARPEFNEQALILAAAIAADAERSGLLVGGPEGGSPPQAPAPAVPATTLAVTPAAAQP